MGACCSYTSRKNTKWCLVCLAITLGVPLFVSAVTLLILGFAVIPRMKVVVEDARLNSFSSIAIATDDNTSLLAYNLSLALAVRNGDVAYVKYTEPLVAYLVFHDRRLCNTTVMDVGRTHPPLKHKLRILHAVGKVPPYVLDDSVVAQDLKNQTATGIFNVEVRLSGEIISPYLGLHVIAKKRKLGFSCPLNLSLAPPGPEVVVFRKVTCKPEEPDKIYF